MPSHNITSQSQPQCARASQGRDLPPSATHGVLRPIAIPHRLPLAKRNTADSADFAEDTMGIPASFESPNSLIKQTLHTASPEAPSADILVDKFVENVQTPRRQIAGPVGTPRPETRTTPVPQVLGTGVIHRGTHEPLVHPTKFVKPVRSVRFIAARVLDRSSRPAGNDTDNTDIVATQPTPTKPLIKHQIPLRDPSQMRTRNSISYGHSPTPKPSPAHTAHLSKPVRSVRSRPRHPSGKAPARGDPPAPPIAPRPSGCHVSSSAVEKGAKPLHATLERLGTPPHKPLETNAHGLELNHQDIAAGEAFARLVATMRRLRAPGGCPWDREQTIASLKPYLLEETYEVLDAIEREDWPSLSEELGDLLLQPVFQAEIAASEGHFSISDPLNAIVEKLIRRHPHVFGTTEAETSDDVLRNWEQIKRGEKAEKAVADGKADDASMLDSLPRALPALAEAQRITSRVAKVGFDWPGISDVLEKLREEIEELEEARQSGDAHKVEDEFGDLLFVMANLARFLKVDAEQSLRLSNLKFRQRFAYIERRLREREKDVHTSTLDEMEALWQEAKQSL